MHMNTAKSDCASDPIFHGYRWRKSFKSVSAFQGLLEYEPNYIFSLVVNGKQLGSCQERQLISKTCISRTGFSVGINQCSVHIILPVIDDCPTSGS